MAALEEPRRNQYFLPGEGIEREVIQSDICKYLDNDAICRPSTHNEMLRDLRADSEKFRRERERVRDRQRRHARSNRNAPQDLRYTDSDTYEHNRARLEERNSDTPVQHRGVQGPPPGNYTQQGSPQYASQHPQSGLYQDQQGYGAQPQQAPAYPPLHQQQQRGYPQHQQGYVPQQNYGQQSGSFPTYVPGQQPQQGQQYPQQSGGYAPPQQNYQNPQIYNQPAGYGGHANQSIETGYGNNAPQQPHSYLPGHPETYINYAGNQQQVTQQQQPQIPQQQQQQQPYQRYDYDYGSRSEIRQEDQVPSRPTNIKAEEGTGNYSDPTRRTKDSKQDRTGSSKEKHRRP